MKENLPPIPVSKYAVCPSCTKTIQLLVDEMERSIISKQEFIKLVCGCDTECYVLEEFLGESEYESRSIALAYYQKLDKVKESKCGDLEEEVENVRSVVDQLNNQIVTVNSKGYAVEKYFYEIMEIAKNKDKYGKLKLTNKELCSTIIKEAKEAIRLIQRD